MLPAAAKSELQTTFSAGGNYIVEAATWQLHGVS